MKTLILILLLSGLAGFSYREENRITWLNDPLKGSWTNERIQLQYIVDSHLVHEQEITAEKGKVYTFDGPTVRVRNPNGAVAQGTYSVYEEDGSTKVVLRLPGATTTYNLIAVTPTSLTWQKDLDDVYYYEGAVRKSAERAIYTEEFKK